MSQALIPSGNIYLVSTTDPALVDKVGTKINAAYSGEERISTEQMFIDISFFNGAITFHEGYEYEFGMAFTDEADEETSGDEEEEEDEVEEKVVSTSCTCTTGSCTCTNCTCSSCTCPSCPTTSTGGDDDEEEEVYIG